MRAESRVYTGTVRPFPAADSPAAAAARVESGKWGYRLTLLYIILEYGRPMDLVPVIGKLRPLMFLSIFLALAWLTYRHKGVAKSSVTTWFVLFMAWMLAHGPFSINTYFAFYLFRGNMQFLVVYLCVVTFVDNPERLRKLHLWIVLVSLMLAVQGIRKHGKVGSYFLGEENDFCLAMNVLLPFSYFALFGRGSKKRKALYLVTLFVCVGAIVYSMSRGGFLGLVAVGGYCWWKSPRKLLGAAALIVIMIAMLVFAGEKYWSEMGTITDEHDSTRQGRIDSWKAAARIFAHNPLGVGAGGYPYAVGDYDYELQAKDRTLLGRAAHSLYFTLLPELGIPGTLFFLGMVFASFRACKEASRHTRGSPDPDAAIVRTMSLATICGFVGFLVSGAFISVLYYPHAYYLAAFAAMDRRIARGMSADGPLDAPESGFTKTRPAWGTPSS